MIRIDRLMNDINAMAEIGALPGGGIRRRALSPEDAEGRAYLTRRMQEAGLAVRTDAAGNVIGRREPGGAGGRGARNRDGGRAAPAVLIGSHIDTIDGGGRYDGVLGVFAALECVRTLDAAGEEVNRAIEVVAFNDEEERFLGFLGSYAFTGEIGYDDIREVADGDGIRLVDAMQQMGLEPARLGEAARDAKSVAAFLELHIEQGPVLEREGATIGVVQQVKGNYRWGVSVTGRTDHAGAPWEGRRDAFLAMHRMVAAMVEFRDRRGDGATTLTVGRVRAEPNIETAQPGEVRFSLDVRSPDRDVLSGAGEALAEAAEKASAAGFRTTVEPILLEEPVDFDPGIVDLIRASADRLGYRRRDMHSGAGHDAQVIGRHMPAAMIFVPSSGGRSHTPEEFTSEEDIEKGADVLYLTTLALAKGAESE